jgi:DNA (cytosine-5)-methyltransferase 1
MTDTGLITQASKVAGGRGRRFPGHAHLFHEITERAAPTIATHPVPVVVELLDVQRRPPLDGRPPYAVESMLDVLARPGCGLVAVSTFSGCGGSCLGLRMAGFRVAWASEFVPAAAATYRANADAATVLDTRDIRDVQPADILAAAGVPAGGVDLMEGSPPCRSFSTAGMREAHWGKSTHYSGGIAQRTDDLFWEFARLVEGVQPRAFIAENVAGLVRGTAKGYFLRILARLKACGYRVDAQLLDASWLGVPQARQRIIIVGVRQDQDRAPVFPKPLRYRYQARDALGELGQPADLEPETGETLAVERLGPSTFIRRVTLAELRALSGFPADFALTGSYAQRWERIGRAVPPLMMRAVAETLRDRVLL